MSRFSILIFSVICLFHSKVFAGGIDQLPAEMKAMLKSLHDNCVSETGVSEDLINAANKGDFKEEKSIKCYMKCLLSTVGIMDDDGVLDWETYEGLLPEFMKEYGGKVLAKCNSIKPAGDACETAFVINKCSYDVDPSMYLLW